uniref:C2H2-type domain-containing protein n=1 Tax=Glossina pallidipes TaxID=7398 RepID=A0A1B0AIJ3_GLOPL
MDSSPQMKNDDAEDCTNTSMYLSCNEESALSSFAFQTLETTLEDPQLYGESMGSDQYLSETLEPLNQSFFLPIKTVKDVDIAPVTPLRPLAENLRLKNSWFALSSTPSKEQLLKTVDVTRGSDANRCMDLCLAFQDMHKNKLSNRALSLLNTENKENVLPEIEDRSSISSSAATTIIEENPLQISAAEVKTMADTKEEIQAARDGDTAGYESLREKKVEYEAKVDETPQDKGVKYEELTAASLKDDGKRVKVSASPLDVIKTTDGDSLVKNLDTKVEAKRSSDKMKPSAIAYDKNLQSKKPSKILPPGQIYQNKLNIPDKRDVTLDPEVDVCNLINKMLRMSDNQQKKTVKAADGATKKINEKPHMPSIAGEKRRVSFSQHMSIEVKTTLNNPARKLARKSILGGATQQPRRSIMPTKSGDVTQFVKSVGTTRKNMLPRAANTIDKATAAKIFPPKKEKLNKLESSTKHSKVEVMSDSKTTVLSARANTKPKATFVCKVCKEKFLAKSLLDAHKRSHEPDINPPTCLKRPSMVPTKTGGSIFGAENKCKYCDKKFALLRTLKIHLLKNCPKIPPVDRRKLQLTEMDHVEKAQLPIFHSKQHSNASSSNATPRAFCNFNIGRQTFRSRIRPIPDTKNVDKKTVVPGEEMMAPPCKSNLRQIKQKTPHSGVYCTPNKLISCHSCNEVFKNVLDYTNHNLSAHGNSSLKKLLDVEAGALFEED